MGEFLVEWLSAVWMVLVESGPYLLVGFALAGLLGELVPAAWVARRLGGDDVKSVATASIIGVPVPLCSCSVIPTATQLRRSGASRGATTSFLISTPETGVDSIGATWALMDPLMTVVRPIAAFVTAFAAGISVNLFGRGGGTPPLDRPDAEPEESCCAHDPAPEPTPLEPAGCCPTAAPAAPAGDGHDHGHDHDTGATDADAPLWRRSLRYAFGTLLDDLAPWFVIGFAISGVIVVAIPDSFFAGALFTGWSAMLAMLVAGVPLYVCATASTPIAAAMMTKGLEPGAALVFLLAGPATNVATILVVRDLLGKRALALYLVTIALASLLLGSIVNRLYPAFGLDPRDMDVTPGAMDHGAIATVSGVVLAVLLARSAWRLRLDRRLGAWLRRAGAPIGLDPTAAPFKAAAALGVVLAYAATALTVVGPGEAVFVERFGRVVAERDTPGRILHAPWPLASARRVATAEVRTREFGVDRSPIRDEVNDTASLRAESRRLERLEEEAEMMTGEGVFVAIEYAVQYRVADPRAWEYGFSAPDELVGRLAQEALRRGTARRRTQELLVPTDDSFVREVEGLLRGALDEADLGAELGSIELIGVHAPRAVHRSFRRIASALVDAEADVTTAEWKAMESMAEARIVAAEDVALATAEAVDRAARAEGDVAALLALDGAWRASPEATERLLILRAWRERAMEVAGDAGRSVTALLSPHIAVQFWGQSDGPPPAPPGRSR